MGRYKHPGDVRAWPRKALHEPGRHYVAIGEQDDRGRCSCILGRADGSPADRVDRVQPQIGQLACEAGQALGFAVGESALNDEVLAFHIT